MFLYDAYHRAEIIRAGIIPAELVYLNESYEPAVVGIDPSRNVYSHIIGTDIVRVGVDDFYVLEDNCRTPSGVSYMLENREIMMRMFPTLFGKRHIEPVEAYPALLRKTLASVAPAKCDGDPTLVILSPGPLNSAYYEHSFLADQMGADLVEGQDLLVDNDRVWMRTTRGPQRVEVIYRRIDDAYLDPLCFRPDSLLGVPGLMNVYRSGGVSICSAPGAGGATLMLGGQRKCGGARLFLMYSEGNFIEATEDTPYLQIGEHKYGKPILDRVVTTETPLNEAVKAALLSMDSTLRSNLSVGMPLDLAVLPTDACAFSERRRIDADDAGFHSLSDAWSQSLRDAFQSIT